MGNAVPKQFLELDGKPILYHTIKAFTDTIPNANIILVLPRIHLSYAQMVLRHFPERLDLSIVVGGATRFDSVKAGLKGVKEDGIVLVHDGVRPLVSSSLIQECCNAARAGQCAIPVTPVSDSIRQVTASGSEPMDRNYLRAVQTPQAFPAAVLLNAYRQPYEESFTDDASVVEAADIIVTLVEGERSNIKITTPEDMVIAEALLRQRAQL
jgi:2-C-methyl-D-erythritol 4-phosphate cytidylyltransferase